MAILKIVSKVIRIETFVVCLSGVLMIMDARKVKLLSLIGLAILVGCSILFLLMDARMIRAKREVSRTQGLQMTGVYFFIGLFLLYSPILMLQVTKLDSFNTASLILGMTLLLINSILFVALWIVPHAKSSG